MRRFYAIVTEPSEWDGQKETAFGGSVELYDQNAQHIATCDDNKDSIAVTLKENTGTPEHEQNVTYVDSREEIADIESYINSGGHY